jgi:hypothetical protein
MNQKINLKGMLAMLLNSILQVQKTSIAETKPTVNPKNAQNEKKEGICGRLWIYRHISVE